MGGFIMLGFRGCNFLGNNCEILMFIILLICLFCNGCGDDNKCCD